MVELLLAVVAYCVVGVIVGRATAIVTDDTDGLFIGIATVLWPFVVFIGLLIIVGSVVSIGARSL